MTASPSKTTTGLAQKRVLLFSGPGGVGKTTCAAAAGVALARQGHRTIVLTVDPARRLAQALGFQSFASEVERIRLPDAPDAQLFASMLDSRRYFDRVIARFATSDAQRERLLNHPLYRMSIDYLGGTHEWAAMERLLEFASDDRYDRIIVDTPPSQNAVDLLTAPQRLADFLDSSVLKWFRKGDRPVAQIFRQGTRLAMKVLQKILGGDFLESLSGFLEALQGMEAGFNQRNLDVKRLLQADSTGFLLVSHPTEARFLESQSFLRTLGAQNIPLSGLILNRLEPEPPAEKADLASLDPAAAKGVTQLINYQRELFDRQGEWLDHFQRLAGGVPLVQVPREYGELHELPALSRLGETLVK